MREKHTDKNPFKGSFGNLENLVEKISDVLKCPVTIEDVNHNLLAYSSHDDQTDAARISTIIGRRVPEKVINKLWKVGVIPKLLHTEEPIRVSEISEVGLSKRVAISIRAKNEILGYIWVLEINNQLNDKDMEMLKNAVNTTRNHLLKLQVRKRKREEGVQEFFWQLLTGHIASHEEIQDKFDNLEIIPPSPFIVMIFQFNHDITLKEERHISYLFSVTQQLRTVFHVLDGNDVILLASPRKDKSSTSFMNDFISRMNKRFHINDITASSGSIYNNFEKIEVSYQEALAVLRLKKQFPKDLADTYNYQKLGIYRYLEVLQQKNKLDNYENVSLQLLSAYDQDHNTNLVDTLNTYLSTDCNVNESARELHIHTNTLIYRLKRISEVGEIDLRNPNEKINLYLDLKLGSFTK